MTPTNTLREAVAEVSGLSIHVTVFAGRTLEDSVREICQLGNRLGIWVTADLNGIHVLSAPNGSADTLWKNYQTARDRGATFVSHNVIPSGLAAPRLDATVRGEEG